MEEWLVFGTIGAVSGLASGIVGAYLMHKRLDAEVAADLYSLKASFDRHINGENSVKGSAASVAARERTDEALLAVALAIKGGKQPADAIKEIAMQYPDVAMRLAKKGLSL